MKLMPAGATRQIGRLILQSKKNSPHIYFAAGLAGVVGGAVLACKATLKLEETLDELKEDMDHVTGEISSDVEEHARNVGLVYMKSAVKLGKLYGPALVVGGIGIASLAGSHRSLTRRNRDLTVALAAMTKAYQAYRDRVAQEIGPEREALIHKGFVNTKKNAKGGLVLADPGALNPYRFVFDSDNVNFEEAGDLNSMFLTASQTHWNRKLRTRGYVFLCEVLDSLGFEATGISGAAGWLWNSETGDNTIDFGIYRLEENIQFQEGETAVIHLDFNVDGAIWDKF